MSTVKISGNASGSGSLTIAAPNTNSDLTLNLPTTLGSNNGSAVVTTDAAGNLGLGVTPSAWNSSYKALQVGASASMWSTGSGGARWGVNYYLNSSDVLTYIGSNFATDYRQSNGAHSWHTAASGTAGNAITFTQAMTLDANGNLLVGTTGNAFGAKLKLQTAASGIPIHATDGTNGDFFVDFPSTSVTRLTAEYGSGGVMVFANGNTKTERARIDSSGNLLVGTTTQTGSFNVTYTGTAQPVSYVYASNASFTNAVYRASMAGTSSSAQLFLGQNNNTNAVFYVQGNGTINSTSTSITGISDVRFKENIRDLDDGLSVVMALKPRKFDWKEGKGANIKNARGFIAQEFEQVLPDLIGEWLEEAPEGEEPYKSVRPDLIPTLVKSIQELSAQTTALKADLDATKAELAALKGAQA